MPKRRGNNEGSISKRKDGTWAGAITVKDPATGAPKRKFFYGKTRQEVAKKLAEVLNDIEKGTYVEPSKLTFSEWLNTWLVDYKKPNLRPTTYTSYEYLNRVHIKPSIGGTLLKDLRAEQLQKFYNDKFKNGAEKGGGLSQSSIKHIHVIIHGALEQAIKTGLIVRNVSTATTLPKQSKKEMRVLTVEEQMKLMEVLREERLEPAFLLDLATGLRLGELLALRWQDIDLKEGIIRVRRALSRVKVFDEETGTKKTMLIFQEPKTKSGKREIPLPSGIIPTLEQHKVQQLTEKLLAKVEYQDDDLMFCTSTGTPIEPRNLIRKFESLIKKSNIPKANFHSLRHTFATRLLEVNEHPKIVQEMLGHSSITLTLDTYSHVMPELKKSAAAKINYLFQRKNSSEDEGI